MLEEKNIVPFVPFLSPLTLPRSKIDSCETTIISKDDSNLVIDISLKSIKRVSKLSTKYILQSNFSSAKTLSKSLNTRT